jgi:hypothetical protein
MLSKYFMEWLEATDACLLHFTANALFRFQSKFPEMEFFSFEDSIWQFYIISQSFRADFSIWIYLSSRALSELLSLVYTEQTIYPQDVCMYVRMRVGPKYPALETRSSKI